MGVGDHPPKHGFERFIDGFYALFDVPVTWLRETIVEPNRAEYNWYHRKYRRVPTIDECYTDDMMCKFEANEQYRRDREVDGKIVNLLARRRDDCMIYERANEEKCQPIIEQYKEAEVNWFIKYGDLGPDATVVAAFMKQKHRLIAERRRALKAQQAAELE
uniref:NADH dehydrogenase [ubiquinone] 1 beta subcomplex subunit 10 n=1 Tax=Amblyomma parvum TaxID=251391 RepID=A0A023FU05_AMBPA